jgi:hypothetical protein
MAAPPNPPGSHETPSRQGLLQDGDFANAGFSNDRMTACAVSGVGCCVAQPGSNPASASNGRARHGVAWHGFLGAMRWLFMEDFLVGQSQST